jgi:sulfite reductase (NADPH) hemoprotein beta-component
VVSGDIRGPGIVPDVRPVIDNVSAGFTRWAATNVLRQKQRGYVSVVVSVPLGDLTAAQMRVLGCLAQAVSDGTVRVSRDQDVILRWVDGGAVPDVYEVLAAAGLGLAEAGTIADVVSCPGAESCRLAVTQSRGLGRTLEEHLRARPELIEDAGTTRIRISGCPNGCGQHHVATLGFQGSVRKIGDSVIPQYFLTVGGAAEDSQARFGRLAAKIPARRITEAIERLVALYQAERLDGEAADAFFARVAVERVKAVVADLERITPQDAVPADYIDLGEETVFNPETMEGECST